MAARCILAGGEPNHTGSAVPAQELHAIADLVQTQKTRMRLRCG
jgi:hypothetical protein